MVARYNHEKITFNIAIGSAEWTNLQIDSFRSFLGSSSPLVFASRFAKYVAVKNCFCFVVINRTTNKFYMVFFWRQPKKTSYSKKKEQTTWNDNSGFGKTPAILSFSYLFAPFVLKLQFNIISYVEWQIIWILYRLWSVNNSRELNWERLFF